MKQVNENKSNKKVEMDNKGYIIKVNNNELRDEYENT